MSGDGARELPHLHAGLLQVGVVVLERRRRRAVVGALGDDEPHLHAVAGGGEDPPDHVTVGDVGVHDVQALARARDLLADRRRRGDEAAGEALGEHDRRAAPVLRDREAGGEVGRQPAAVAVEAREERRLQLAHDVPRDPDHHVVEPAVVEVVLQPGAARPPPSTSARMRGKKLAPSTHGSIVAAVLQANSSVASRGRARGRSANAGPPDSGGWRDARADGWTPPYARGVALLIDQSKSVSWVSSA
jgi:hypothetical protein